MPRILALLNRYQVKATFRTPTHTMVTFPERFRSIVDAGHEIAAHGCYHESVPSLDAREHLRQSRQSSWSCRSRGT